MQVSFSRTIQIKASNLSDLKEIGAIFKPDVELMQEIIEQEVEISSHNNNYIKASGMLRLHLSGDGKISSVSLEGAEVDVKAKNLIVESLQDVLKEHLSGMNFGADFNKTDLTGISAGGEGGSREKSWTNQIGRIIGTKVVNVVVENTLELVGSMIVNAEVGEDGKLTDKGNLSINCAQLITKAIHDYDQGLTLGVGVHGNLQKSEIDSGSLKVDLRDGKQSVKAVIGKGSLTIKNPGASSFAELSRNIQEQITDYRMEHGSVDTTVERYSKLS
jgi:hypothetical protein